MMKLKAGQQVEIYRNLNRKGLWFSVRDKESGLVVHRINLKDGDALVLKNVKFKVSEAGRQRVLREKRKNVHALIKAEVQSVPKYETQFVGFMPFHVQYDPYKYESFMMTVFYRKFTDKRPIHDAEFVTLDKRGVIAWVRI